MPLEDIDISINNSVLPDDVVALILEADSRVSEYVRNSPICVTGFAPSDFVTVYHVLRVIAEANLAPGNSMCEWGSGFGVVASLAAMLDFNANGIELQKVLVDASRKLAGDFTLPVKFVHGSFVPSCAEADASINLASDGLTTAADDAYSELKINLDEIDVVFAYPWPDEECLTKGLFEKYAAEGSLLLMYNKTNSVRLQRKVGK